jgi:hypothetical protein
MLFLSFSMPDMESATGGTGIDTEPSIASPLGEFMQMLEGVIEVAVTDLPLAGPLPAQLLQAGHEFPGGASKRALGDDPASRFTSLPDPVGAGLTQELFPLSLQSIQVGANVLVLVGYRLCFKGLDKQREAAGQALLCSEICQWGSLFPERKGYRGGPLGGLSIGEDKANKQALKSR